MWRHSSAFVLLVSAICFTGSVWGIGAQSGPDPGVVPTQILGRPEIRIFRVELQPGATRRTHSHGDVLYHVWIPLEGRLELSVAGERPVIGLPGEAVYLNRGTIHGFKNIGSTTAAVMEVFIEDVDERISRDAEGEVLRLAAEQGDADAQHRLGQAYQTGNSLEQDVETAIMWYRLAAEQGHAPAQNDMGNAYANGMGVAEDYGEAVRWFRLAAEVGYPVAQTNLGLAYSKGVGVEPSSEDAVRWFSLAAEQGHFLSQYHLGVAYANGEGAPYDTGEAVRWFGLAANQDYAAAQYNLGIAHANGLGVDPNAAEAVRWFHLASDQGHAAAQGNLGIAYSNGLGVVRDAVEAARWFRLAAERGYAPAGYNLTELEGIMTFEELAEAERLAREWEAAQQPSR